MTRLLLFTMIFLTLSAQGAPADDGVQRLCLEENVQERIRDRRNRISFLNQGGLFNGGVCWWHSRLLRNATYLAYYSPEKERPHQRTTLQLVRFPDPKAPKGLRIPAKGSVKYILQKIKDGKDVVEIPGFQDLNSFTAAYQDEAQEVLNGWQIEEGVVDQSWIIGLKGSTELAPNELQERMRNLYFRIRDGEIVYQKLQLSGITAHAWLVIGMEETSRGYIVQVIDSNFREIQTYQYRFGDSSFFHYAYGSFVPYTENVQEEVRARKVRSEFCRRKGL